MANKYQSKAVKSSNLAKYLTVIGLTFLTGLVLYISNIFINKNQVFEVGAATGKAELFFEPQTTSITTDTTIKLWITSDKPVGFIDLQLSFDKNLINLSQDVLVTNPALQELIIKSSVSEANNTGVIRVALAVSPKTMANSPTGTFSILSMKFASKSKIPDEQTKLAFSTGLLQVVDMGATPFSLSSKDAILTLNPTTPTPSIKPSTTPISTSTPTPKPSATVKPYPSPSSAPVDLTGPELTLTTGRDWRGFWVKAKAKDDSDVSSINMVKNNETIKICTNKNTCIYFYKKAERGQEIQVTASDASVQRNTSFDSIVSK